MKSSKSIKFIWLIAIIIFIALDVDAQCAMCKAVAKSDLESGGDIGNGINTGILYLMAIPYVILAIGGYFFFKKTIDAKLKEFKQKYFPAKNTAAE